MPQGHRSGKLAVILHADIAGSTSLVQRDEHLAHERIQDAFRRFREAITQYQGRVRELRGDALLAEFERASDAVTAALAFQAEQAGHNAQLTDDIRPTVRVGIAMGEVVIADSTVTGAGVVLAQRVEQLAEPGGVCITAALHETLPSRLPFDTTSLGEQELKGFEDSVRVHKVELRPGATIPTPEAGRQQSARSRARQWLVWLSLLLLILISGLFIWTETRDAREAVVSEESREYSTSEKPSIAVLPFDNMSGDPEQDYFVDGVTEDIAIDLSRLSNLVVIAWSSSFTYKGTDKPPQEIGTELGVKYILHGSVRKSGDQVRISTQLTDATNGHQLWAERFDRKLDDIFAVQDGIAKTIISRLSVRLAGDEYLQLGQLKANSFAAYDEYLQGYKIFQGYNREANELAQSHYRKAIALDPKFGRAYGSLAVAIARGSLVGWSEDPIEALDEALQLALQAAELSPYVPQVHWALGYTYMQRREHAKAIAAVNRAVELAPNFADGFALLALINSAMGRADESTRLIRRGMTLNPSYTWDYPYILGRSLYIKGDYEGAVKSLEESLERNPSSAYARMFLAASLLNLDRNDDAEWNLMLLENEQPDLTVEIVNQRIPAKDVPYKAKFLEDLRKIGMTEK